ncbi:MAG: DUF2608 domain-containing protein [Bdellovibrionales bacterium]|nr:DUF2608 domain-containing protein [Bdellovibrionales bacterium]
MKQLKVVFSSLLVIIASSALAEIREAGSMQEALASVRSTDFVVFDIDNTILAPTQTIGSDQWFEYKVEQNRHKGMSDNAAIEAAAVDWARVQQITNVELVESITASYIRKMQMEGVTVIALTARSPQVRAITKKQLESLGVYFTPNNVLFAQGRNKGVVLKEYMGVMKMQPGRIVFLDDKIKNVQNMDEAFVGASFPNINYRYGGADAKVQAFSPEVAEIQWKYFTNQNILISDDQAEDLLGPLL